MFAVFSIGSLFAVSAQLQLRILMMALLAFLLIEPRTLSSASYILILALTTGAAFAPRYFSSRLLRAPRWALHILGVLTAVCISAMLMTNSVIATVAALLSGFYIGAALSRKLAMADARLLAWGDDGLVGVTRDLLLGRITSGMLHDLAQPLNVISMANGNLGYIAEHLPIDEDTRRQLLDRTDRIAEHTQTAAAILSVFRWFGCDGSDQPADLTVRSALERATTATRSNVRHHDVAVELHGNGLDYLLSSRHGCLELIAVAALLCAFASFTAPDGTRRRGRVLLHATQTPAHITISVHCVDLEGAAVSGRSMDYATTWLIEQVAQEADGDFRSISRRNQPERFVIRLGRDDI